MQPTPAVNPVSRNEARSPCGTPTSPPDTPSRPTASLAGWIRCCLCLVFVFSAVAAPAAADQPALEGLGPKTAVMLVDPHGHTILAHNQATRLIPASTLKIFTALMALHELGTDFRFVTDFFIDPAGNLRVKGYGDPLLVSEVLKEIAAQLSRQVSRIGDIVIDDGYFDKPLTIPGVSDSYEPYDAPNGALGANFNTVNFARRNGRYVSAEPQTPLLPMVMARIERSGLERGRIVLSHHNRECTRYFGRLLGHYLRQEGVDTNGRIRWAPADATRHRLLYRHTSPFDLPQIVEKLLEYSNNYITNQLLITVGARRYGPPGTLTKGIRAAESFARSELGLQRLTMAEGSGISRANRVTAREMIRILGRFQPHRRLLRHRTGEYYKTGTLSGISTRAGYLVDRHGRLYPYAILVNSRRYSAEQILDRVRQFLPK